MAVFRKSKAVNISEKPNEGDFVTHFKALLDGHDVHLQTQTLELTLSEDFTELGSDEFTTHIQNLKCNKASGCDQLKSEAIKFADSVTKNNLRRIMERCLNGEPIPESWREATIWPIHKNGSMKLAENYRGITLSNSIYKLYASIFFRVLFQSRKSSQREKIFYKTHRMVLEKCAAQLITSTF